mgnify:FL=1|jgi:hypothetical protein
MKQPPKLVQIINKIFFEPIDQTIHWHNKEHMQDVANRLKLYNTADYGGREKTSSSLRKILADKNFKLQNTENNTEYWKGESGDIFTISNHLTSFSSYHFACAQANDITTKTMLGDSMIRQKRESSANIIARVTTSALTVLCVGYELLYMSLGPVSYNVVPFATIAIGLVASYQAVKHQIGAKILKNFSESFELERYDDAHNVFYKQTGDIKQDQFSIGYTAILRMLDNSKGD